MSFVQSSWEIAPSRRWVTWGTARKNRGEARQASLSFFRSAVFSCHALLTERPEEATLEMN